MTTEQLSTECERADLIESLERHRWFLRFAVRELSEEEATRRTTVSELNLAGLVKHVAAGEEAWVRFIVEGPSALGDFTDFSEAAMAARSDEFRLLDGETLDSVLAEYDAVAARTNELVRTLPDLNVSHPLPEAPWFEPGAAWSARRALLHIIAETAQHAGHADIIRESLDGALTMG
ncbi:DinB family protein [Tomitella biformata]|uniref:DinB family protein n=1 Tax=Tomitella biformata TaxID=630403 RepID=UPI000464D255|nr:DinB family protein [Tomitella biformata]